MGVCVCVCVQGAVPVVGRTEKLLSLDKITCHKKGTWGKKCLPLRSPGLAWLLMLSRLQGLGTQGLPAGRRREWLVWAEAEVAGTDQGISLFKNKGINTLISSLLPTSPVKFTCAHIHTADADLCVQMHTHTGTDEHLGTCAGAHTYIWAHRPCSSVGSIWSTTEWPSPAKQGPLGWVFFPV